MDNLREILKASLELDNQLLDLSNYALSSSADDEEKGDGEEMREEEEMIETLAEWLMLHPSLHMLYLDNCNLSNASVSRLASKLSPTIHTLSLKGNHRLSSVATTALVRLMKQRKTLTTLCLLENEGLSAENLDELCVCYVESEHVHSLCGMSGEENELASTLSTLSDVKLIAAELASHKTSLKFLDLRIDVEARGVEARGEEEVLPIFTALADNKSLVTFRCLGMNFTEDISHKLAIFLRKNRTIKTLELQHDDRHNHDLSTSQETTTCPLFRGLRHNTSLTTLRLENILIFPKQRTSEVLTEFASCLAENTSLLHLVIFTENLERTIPSVVAPGMGRAIVHSSSLRMIRLMTKRSGKLAPSARALTHPQLKAFFLEKTSTERMQKRKPLLVRINNDEHLLGAGDAAQGNSELNFDWEVDDEVEVRVMDGAFAGSGEGGGGGGGKANYKQPSWSPARVLFIGETDEPSYIKNLTFCVQFAEGEVKTEVSSETLRRPNGSNTIRNDSLIPSSNVSSASHTIDELTKGSTSNNYGPKRVAFDEDGDNEDEDLASEEFHVEDRGGGNRRQEEEEDDEDEEKIRNQYRYQTQQQHQHREMALKQQPKSGEADVDDRYSDSGETRHKQQQQHQHQAQHHHTKQPTPPGQPRPSPVSHSEQQKKLRFSSLRREIIDEDGDVTSESKHKQHAHVQATKGKVKFAASAVSPALGEDKEDAESVLKKVPHHVTFSTPPIPSTPPATFPSRPDLFTGDRVSIGKTGLIGTITGLKRDGSCDVKMDSGETRFDLSWKSVKLLTDKHAAKGTPAAEMQQQQHFPQFQQQQQKQQKHHHIQPLLEINDEDVRSMASPLLQATSPPPTLSFSPYPRSSETYGLAASLDSPDSLSFLPREGFMSSGGNNSSSRRDLPLAFRILSDLDKAKDHAKMAEKIKETFGVLRRPEDLEALEDYDVNELSILLATIPARRFKAAMCV